MIPGRPGSAGLMRPAWVGIAVRIHPVSETALRRSQNFLNLAIGPSADLRGT
jgi:hypothetical protein